MQIQKGGRARGMPKGPSPAAPEGDDKAWKTGWPLGVPTSREAAWCQALGPTKMSVIPQLQPFVWRGSRMWERRKKKKLPWHQPFWISATEQMPIAWPPEQLFHPQGAKIRGKGLKYKSLLLHTGLGQGRISCPESC